MFLHTSCSYSPYVTPSTPALASFRRPSKAAINAAGVADAQAREIASSCLPWPVQITDSVLWTWCSTSECRHVSPNRGGLMFPPSLQWVPWPPLAGPCGSPPSRVLWGRTTAPPSIHGHLWSPLVAGTSSEEMGSSLGFLENPFGSMPRARDSGGPRTSSPYRPSRYSLPLA